MVVFDGGGAWGSAQEEAYFKPFTAATGIKVIEDSSITQAQLQTQIQAGKPSVDAMDMDGEFFPAFVDEGYLQPIDYSSWPAEQLAAFTPIPTTKYGVPALIYSIQIASKPGPAGQPTISSWADFFNPQKFPGKRSMGDVAIGSLAVGTLDAALLAIGKNPADMNPQLVTAAFAELTKLRPDILNFWQSGAQPIQEVSTGQVVAAPAWNGRIESAVEAGTKIASTWNGQILYHDNWVIPKGSSNAANASKFIEFASQPAQQAKFAQLITYGATNSDAYKLIPAARQALLPNSPANLTDAAQPSDTFWATKAPDGKLWYTEIQTMWQKWLSGG